MIKNNKFTAAYEAPVCEALQAVAGGVLCGSFFSGDQIPDVDEGDWGVFGSTSSATGIFD